jgi:hypothetical protein
MFRNPVLEVAVVVLVLGAHSARAADLWVVPYGSASIFRDCSSAKNLSIRNPAIEQPDIGVSQASDGVGGGVTIGADFQGVGGILGLNIELLTASADFTFAEVDTLLGPGQLHLDTPAIAIGGFYAGELPWVTSEAFRGYGGLEFGVLQTRGNVKINYIEEVPDENDPSIVTYEPREESVDLGKMTVYMSLFVTEEYNLSGRFGLSGTLGYRAMTSSIEGVASKSIAGGYGQDYSGLFVRVGLRVDL